MASLPPIRRILQEDIPNSPSWFGRVQYIVNTFMQTIYSALSGNLTFQQNIRSQIVTLSFTTDKAYNTGTFVPLTFARTINVKATGLLILQITNSTTAATTPIQTATSLSWRDLGTGTISVDFIAGLANSTQYTVTMLLI